MNTERNQLIQIRNASDLENRSKLGETLQADHGERFMFIGNVWQALPIEARKQLEEHTVNPKLYEGRMPWIAASYMLTNKPVVLMHESPLQAELEILDEVCSKIGIPTPEIRISDKPFDYNESSIRSSVDLEGENYYFHPFIGTNEFGSNNSNALPDSTPFNDKAVMRRLMKSNGLKHNVIPGDEIFHEDGEGQINQLKRVKDVVQSQEHQKVRVKLGDTASGLCTVVIDKMKFDSDRDYRLYILQEIRSFTKNETGNLVIEQELEKSDNWIDYGTRGYISENGIFIPTSIAMQITDSHGVYLGGVVTVPSNGHWIGLTDEETEDMLLTTEKLAVAVYEKGHRGPVNPDMFRNKSSRHQDGDKPHPSLSHDFNFRDGGTSASGFIAEAIYPSQTVIDLDLAFKTSRKLNEEELNKMVSFYWEEGILIYSTIFLRHPKITIDGEYNYTVKTIAEPSCPISDLDKQKEEISSLIDKLNKSDLGSFSFNSD